MRVLITGVGVGAHAVPGITVHACDVGLRALLASSDVLACALPLTPQTRGRLDRGTLSQLAIGAYVINVGRGEQMIEADLRALLDAWPAPRSTCARAGRAQPRAGDKLAEY